MIGRRLQAILVGASALALIAAGGAPVGTVRGVVGQVEIQAAPGSEWRAAQVGDELSPGGSLRTGAASRAELALDGATVRLYELSLARVPERTARTRRLDLAHGASSFDIQPSAEGKFEVHTPTTIALAKGTCFTVTADGGGSTVSVQRGLVGVREPGSVAREVLIHPGFGATRGPGRPFALGLLQKGDPWKAWSRGAAPSRPFEAAADAAPPANADGVELMLPGAVDAGVRIVGSGRTARVLVQGPEGLEAALNRRDLEEVLRGNTAALGAELLSILRARGVTPAAFAHQVLDNL